MSEILKNADEKIAELIDKEVERQNSHIELIASENWISDAALEALGSPLTNKYAEGYPGHRYYGGCEVIDEIEEIAIDRAKELFNCTYANVQPHSGSQANQAVYYTLLEPGDKVLGMGLNEGGHLTHGSPVNISGNYYDFYSYGLDENGLIDYDQVLEMAKEIKPKLIVAGASAYPRKIDFKRFREIADEVGALFMVDIAHIAGLVAAGLHESPIPYADVVTTTTHKTLRGPRGGLILSSKENNDKYNFNRGVFPGIQGGPLMHVIASKAVCLNEALNDDFIDYQTQIVKNAAALAEGLKKRGLKLISDGTDNHLILIDLRDSDVTGKELEVRLDKAHITTNKNSVVDDPRPISQTSGLRIGTPAVTTRGFKEPEMDQIADWIARIYESEDNIPQVREEVAELCESFPL